jgi:hypothetical protein
MTGCVYGFIDVPEGIISIYLVGDGVHGDAGARLDRYYSEGQPLYTTAIPQAVTLQKLPTTMTQYADSSLPRRSLTRYNGGLYQFGEQSTNENTLFQIIFPERTTTLTGDTSFVNQTKLAVTVDIPEFASAVERKERFSEIVLNPVLYVGSVSKGKVYRYDGVALSEETTGLANKRIIVALYQEDVYAACENKLQKRGFDGAWSTSIALTLTKTWNAAAEYLSKFYLVGEDSVLSYDGTTVTVSPVVKIVTYDGSTFTTLITYGGDGPIIPGCFETSGDFLFWTLKDDETPLIPTLYIYDGSAVTGPYGPDDVGENVQADMVAF